MERLDRIEKIIEKNALAMTELCKSQEETSVGFKETKELFKKIEAQIAKSEAKLVKR